MDLTSLRTAPDHIVEAMRRHVRNLATVELGNVKRNGESGALREAARDELQRRS